MSEPIKQAAPVKPVANPELESLAFEIFKETVAKIPANRLGEQVAIEAYRKAEAFLKIRDRVRSGEPLVKQADGPQLCDASAPNLKKTHPHNLVSKRFGDLAKVNRIAKWLGDNPTTETSEEMDWDAPTTALARVLLPAYCS